MKDRTNDVRANDLRRLVTYIINTYGLAMALTALIDVLSNRAGRNEQYILNVLKNLRRTLKQYLDRYKDEEGA